MVRFAVPGRLGVAGGVSRIEAAGVEQVLGELRRSPKDRTYRPLPVRRFPFFGSGSCSRSRIYASRTPAETDQMIPSSREHSELLDLMEARDADAAEELMSRHIGHIPGICANRDAERE